MILAILTDVRADFGHILNFETANSSRLQTLKACTRRPQLCYMYYSTILSSMCASILSKSDFICSQNCLFFFTVTLSGHIVSGVLVSNAIGRGISFFAKGSQRIFLLRQKYGLFLCVSTLFTCNEYSFCMPEPRNIFFYDFLVSSLSS